MRTLYRYIDKYSIILDISVYANSNERGSLSSSSDNSSHGGQLSIYFNPANLFPRRSGIDTFVHDGTLVIIAIAFYLTHWARTREDESANTIVTIDARARIFNNWYVNKERSIYPVIRTTALKFRTLTRYIIDCLTVYPIDNDYRAN